MDLEKLENIWAIAGTIGIIAATWYRSSKNNNKKINDLIDSPINDTSLVGQSLEISAAQTDMLNRLLERADENDEAIKKLSNELDVQKKNNSKMKIRLNELEAMNKQLEKYRAVQAEQINRLKARVAQLETELKRNDLTIPDPPKKSDKD